MAKESGNGSDLQDATSRSRSGHSRDFVRVLTGAPEPFLEAIAGLPDLAHDLQPVAPGFVADEDVPVVPLGGRAKRALDLMIVLPMLVLLLPVMILIGGLITLTINESPIFSHERVGFRGRTFLCYKFRTMAPDADVALARLLASDPAAAAEWAQRRKLRNDPRVTRLGRILRKSSLDELPQLINVLIGDMSCVGPRPVTQEELDRYGTRIGAYFAARPGISGLWQVAGRSSTDFATRVVLDEQYVRNWSLAVDIAILLRTPAAVLRIRETG